MSRPSWLQKIYWSRFAKPVEDRALFSALLQNPVSSILELGMGDGERMRRIGRLAQIPPGVDVLRYVGTDEFESAEDGKRHLTLKQAHQVAGQLGFKASLIPGNLATAIPRVAHKLGASDLIVINGGLDPDNPREGMIAGWMDRLAHDRSIILASDQPGAELKLLDPAALELPIRRAA